MHEKYRLVTFVILCEFILHKLAYSAGWIDTKILTGAWLYVAYASLNLAAIYFMKKYLAHFFITFLFLINAAYNLLTAFNYISVNFGIPNESFIVLYEQFSIFVGIIMLLEVIFCWMLLFNVRSNVRKYGSEFGIDNIDRHFLFKRKHDDWRSGWAVS